MPHRLAEVLPAPPALRVLPRGTAMVQDYGALVDAGDRRFHGWKFDTTQGPEFVDKGDGKTKRHGGFVRQTGAVVVIPPNSPYLTEYKRHLRDGDLWAADQATADAAGVPFEPQFGGEHPEYVPPAKLATPAVAQPSAKV